MLLRGPVSRPRPGARPAVSEPDVVVSDPTGELEVEELVSRVEERACEELRRGLASLARSVVEASDVPRRLAEEYVAKPIVSTAPKAFEKGGPLEKAGALLASAGAGAVVGAASVFSLKAWQETLASAARAVEAVQRKGLKAVAEAVESAVKTASESPTTAAYVAGELLGAAVGPKLVPVRVERIPTLKGFGVRVKTAVGEKTLAYLLSGEGKTVVGLGSPAKEKLFLELRAAERLDLNVSGLYKSKADVLDTVKALERFGVPGEAEQLRKVHEIVTELRGPARKLSKKLLADFEPSLEARYGEAGRAVAEVLKKRKSEVATVYGSQAIKHAMERAGAEFWRTPHDVDVQLRMTSVQKLRKVFGAFDPERRAEEVAEEIAKAINEAAGKTVVKVEGKKVVDAARGDVVVDVHAAGERSSGGLNVSGPAQGYLLGSRKPGPVKAKGGLRVAGLDYAVASKGEAVSGLRKITKASLESQLRSGVKVDNPKYVDWLRKVVEERGEAYYTAPASYRFKDPADFLDVARFVAEKGLKGSKRQKVLKLLDELEREWREKGILPEDYRPGKPKVEALKALAETGGGGSPSLASPAASTALGPLPWSAGSPAPSRSSSIPGSRTGGRAESSLSPSPSSRGASPLALVSPGGAAGPLALTGSPSSSGGGSHGVYVGHRPRSAGSAGSSGSGGGSASSGSPGGKSGGRGQSSSGSSGGGEGGYAGHSPSEQESGENPSPTPTPEPTPWWHWPPPPDDEEGKERPTPPPPPPPPLQRPSPRDYSRPKLPRLLPLLMRVSEKGSEGDYVGHPPSPPSTPSSSGGSSGSGSAAPLVTPPQPPPPKPKRKRGRGRGGSGPAPWPWPPWPAPRPRARSAGHGRTYVELLLPEVASPLSVVLGRTRRRGGPCGTGS